MQRQHQWNASRYCLPLLLLASLSLSACKEKNAYVPPPPPSVGVANPVKQQVVPFIALTGNTVAVNQISLVARVSGFLQQIAYQDGARVKKGDLLFVIEPAPYDAKLRQAQAAVVAAAAAKLHAQQEYARQSSLGRDQFASQSKVDDAKATLDQDTANLLSQQAGTDLAQIDLGYTNVTAPFAGVVTNHLQSVGAYVGGTTPTPLANLVQLDPIYVVFNVSEQDVLRIKSAMQRLDLKPEDLAKVVVEVGLMTDTGYPHRGTLDYISPELDTSTGTLMVRGVFPNANGELLPGLFVRVRVPMQRQEHDALLVPDAAISADQSGRYLLIVNKDNVVEQRSVTTGQLVGQLRVIATGIAADDRVVVTGLSRAVPGSKVAPKPAEIKAAAATP